mmetsp:Transcript_80352/g.236395  ORF Transcript_80352/g.236395 Transcript_80352/m.236395 type:complete len:212 (-) Transcript_80352:764-1399(-)
MGPDSVLPRRQRSLRRRSAIRTCCGAVSSASSGVAAQSRAFAAVRIFAKPAPLTTAATSSRLSHSAPTSEAATRPTFEGTSKTTEASPKKLPLLGCPTTSPPCTALHSPRSMMMILLLTSPSASRHSCLPKVVRCRLLARAFCSSREITSREKRGTLSKKGWRESRRWARAESASARFRDTRWSECPRCRETSPSTLPKSPVRLFSAGSTG